MNESLRIFQLLLYKNFLVRKRHWKILLFVEITIPIVLFLIGQLVFTTANAAPVMIDHNTFTSPELQEDMRVSWSTLKIQYTPNNKLTNRIMRLTQECMNIPATQVNGSATEETMLAEISRANAEDTSVHYYGVVFTDVQNKTLPKNFKYKLRMPGSLPRYLYQEMENGNAAEHITLDEPGIVPLQICLDEAYIKIAAPKSPARNFKMAVQRMPYPPYIRVDETAQIVGKIFAEIARFAFIIVMCIEVTFVMNEKFIGINILMSVNGVKNCQNLFSWLISSVIFSVIYLVPIVAILKYFYLDFTLPYLMYSDTFLVWALFVIHVCHTIAFGMHVTAYLWKPSHGIFAAFVVAMLMDALNNFITGSRFRRFSIYLGIFSPNFLLSRIFEEINIYEMRLVGLQWTNIFKVGNSAASGDGCVGALVIFSMLGIALNFLMTVYVYAVRPGKFGVAQNPLFCLLGCKRGPSDAREMGDVDYNAGNQKEFENVPEGSLTPGIQIRELKKAYTIDWFRRTRVEALKGINVDFYKGQITALLGHNGAGKTTMMSILAGLTSSSKGAVFVNGKNVQREMDAVRGNLGLCPQENMVFPNLNVYEQVLFFGMLKAKGKSKSQLENEVDVLLKKMNLIEKKNSMPKQLSGGQKRRLCLAMAVIGDASVLILDEPTSGMDAESKREVWDMILKLRGEKTILISTHDMEEADILGDRIAIIHLGKMRSYGTSMFLKKLYGDGQVEVTLSIEPSCNPHRIIEEIELNAQLLSQDDGKAVLAIPLADDLPKALDQLEAQKKKFGITGLSVSVITLEQIFLRVTREEGDETDSIGEAAKSFVKLQGFPYLLQTCFAHIVKKLAFTRKNPWTFIICMILPCLSVVSLALGHDSPSGTRETVSVSLDAYYRTRSLCSADESIYAEMYKKSAESFGGTSTFIGSNIDMSEALLKVAGESLATYRDKYIVSAEFNTSDDQFRANGFYSGTAIFGIPATINMLSNTIVKAAKGDDGYKISISMQQLPKIAESSTRTHSSDFFFVTLALFVFLTPAVAHYVSQPLLENVSGVKQLELMTGASTLLYWLSTYLFDLLQYVVSIILLISLFVIADTSFGMNYYRGTEIMITFLLLFMFGASTLPLVYLFTFWKKSMNASINVLSIAPLVLCAVDMIFYGLDYGWENKIYKIFRKVERHLVLLIPHTTLVYGHVSFFDAMAKTGYCRRISYKNPEDPCGESTPCCELKCRNGSCENSPSYFKHEMAFLTLGDSLLWMTGSLFLYFAIIFILEQNLVLRLWARVRRAPPKGRTSEADELVMKEAKIVSTEIATWLLRGKSQYFTDQAAEIVSTEAATWLLREENNENLGSDNIFLAHEISKNYGNLEVVKGISFRVKQGECFGLLGVNGAGKSTTFRMLTGAELPRSGTMYLKEYSLANDRTRYLAEMGYCPQQDAIIDTLNAYDHLYLFARLRGIPENEVKATIDTWIQKLNLKRCAGQPSGTYSGGNKRRLNIAMALIGNPSLVLMDEPTTGVDPAARRSLWNTLKTCQEGGQSIILTSHSMEECEALCNRLVIMVKGQLVCIGASQELKQRFGAGYNIHVKLNPVCEKNDVSKIKRRIETTLVCKLSDENAGFIGYHVTDPEATWTKMYTMMNKLKLEYPCIEDFAVLSSTLEQLFIQFARAPGDADGEKSSKTRWWQRKKQQGSPV